MKNYLIRALLLGFLGISLLAHAQRPSKAKPGLGKPPRTNVVTPANYNVNADSAYDKKVWISQKGDTLRYRLLLPENYDSTKMYPLVLFLHGAGERGNDNKKQLVHGSKLFLMPDVRKNYPAIVVIPQCDSLGFWSNVQIKVNDTTKKRTFEFQENGEPTKAMSLLLEWLPALEKQYPSLPQQRYVMGLSMGGMGTFELVRRKPGYFAAAIPICGGAHTKTAAAMKKTDFWIFHGQKDDVVPYELSEKIAIAFSELYDHPEVQLTLYPDANHNSWDKAFAEPELLLWLFGKKRNQ
jgi:predicted peptidase